MATLSTAELAELRNQVQGAHYRPDITKPQLNLAFQQVEDWFEANRASLAAAITGPFTATQKRQLGTYWLRQKAARGG